MSSTKTTLARLMPTEAKAPAAASASARHTRLRACARVVIRKLAGVQLHDKNFSLYGAVQELEAKIIEQALEETGGSVTKAAKLLGLKHQTLGSILNQRHKRLLKKRKPLIPRRRSIIKEPKD